MILRGLAGRSWRHHAATEIEIPEGLVAIGGPIGAGKSTLFEMILFALYGSGKHVRGVNDSVRSHFAPAGAVPEVRLDFEVGGRPYTVWRQLGKGAQLTADGATLATGQAPVTAAVAKLVGMNPDELAATVYVRQKDLSFLRDLGPTARAAFLGRLAGFDVIERASVNIGRRARVYRGDVKALEEAGLDTSELEVRAELAEAAAKTANGMLRVAVAAEAHAVQRQQALMNAQAELDQATRRLSTAAQSLDSVQRDLLRVGQQRDSYAQRIERAELAVSRAQASAEVLPTRAAELEEALEAYTKANEAHAEAMLDARQKRMELKRRVEECVAGQAALLKQIEVLDGAEGATCPTCNQPADPVALRDDLVAKHSDLDQLRRRCLAEERAGVPDPDSSERDRLARELERARTAAQEARQRARGLEEAREAAATLRRDQAASDQACAALERSLAEAKRAAEQAEAEHDAAVAASEGAQQAEADLKAAQRARSEAAESDRRAQAALVEIRGKLEERRNRRERWGQLTAEEAVWSEAHRLTADLHTTLVSSLRPSLGARASGLIAEATGGAYTSVELSESYAPTLVRRGVLTEVISGGEEDVASLALRLGMSWLLSDLRGGSVQTLLLDEVLASVDRETTLPAVVGMMRGLLGHFPQMLNISHVDISDAADAVIRCQRDELGISRVEVER